MESFVRLAETETVFLSSLLSLLVSLSIPSPVKHPRASRPSHADSDSCPCPVCGDICHLLVVDRIGSARAMGSAVDFSAWIDLHPSGGDVVSQLLTLTLPTAPFPIWDNDNINRASLSGARTGFCPMVTSCRSTQTQRPGMKLPLTPNALMEVSFV